MDIRAEDIIEKYRERLSACTHDLLVLETVVGNLTAELVQRDQEIERLKSRRKASPRRQDSL